MALYTKNGRPLQVSGNNVFSRSGAFVGRVKDDKVFGPDGRYVGTISGDRLVFRSSQSGAATSSYSAVNRVGSAMASAVSSAIWGDEPNIPD